MNDNLGKIRQGAIGELLYTLTRSIGIEIGKRKEHQKQLGIY